MSLLEVKDLVAGYGPVQVLHGISLSVEEGQVAVVLGHREVVEQRAGHPTRTGVAQRGQVEADAVVPRREVAEQVVAAGVGGHRAGQRKAVLGRGRPRILPVPGKRPHQLRRIPKF